MVSRWAGVYRVKSRELPTRVKEVVTLLVNSQICRKQLGHAIFETQKEPDLTPVKRALATVEILLPRLNQQSQSELSVLWGKGDRGCSDFSVEPEWHSNHALPAELVSDIS